MPFKTWNIIEHKREIQKGRTRDYNGAVIKTYVNNIESQMAISFIHLIYNTLQGNPYL